MDDRAKAFSAVRWTAIAALSRALFAFAQLVILARLLAPSDFGLIAMVLTITSTLSLVSDVGVSNALIHFGDATQSELSSLYWFNLFTGGVLSVLVVAFSPVLAQFYQKPDVAGIIVFVSPLFLFAAIGQQIRVRAEKELKFAPVARNDVLASFLGMVAAISGAAMGLGAYSVPLGLLVSALMNSVLSWITVSMGWRPSLVFNLREIGKFVKFGLHLIGTTFANSLAMYSDIIVFGRSFSSDSLGLYSQPRELCMRIMLSVNPIITRVSLPLIAQSQKDIVRLGRIYSNVVRMTTSVNFPIYAAIAVLAPEVVVVVLGERWASSSDLLRLLAIWCMVRSISNPIGSLLYAVGQTKRAMISSILVMVGTFSSVLIGKFFGASGVPASLAIFYTILIWPFWRFVVYPACNVEWKHYIKQIAIPLCAASAAAGAALIVGLFVSGAWLRIITMGGTGAIAYFLASVVINRTWLFAMRDLMMVRGRFLGVGSR